MSHPIRKVNLTEMFGRFQDQWSPKIVGAVNDNLVKLTKLKGEFVWHHHEREDELFLVVCVFWGSTYLAIKVGVTELPPFLFAGLRFLVGKRPQ